MKKLSKKQLQAIHAKKDYVPVIAIYKATNHPSLSLFKARKGGKLKNMTQSSAFHQAAVTGSEMLSKKDIPIGSSRLSMALPKKYAMKLKPLDLIGKKMPGKIVEDSAYIATKKIKPNRTDQSGELLVKRRAPAAEQLGLE